ncbi:MAG TPA: hypothetical protein DCS29_04350 [Candidatus Magasanikbacteria bacterium]|nr:MAG: hypothetical protein A2479_00680 [Candidatus Magasanikbacteria bacterium RIFOXYC2_FULL_39_8]HAT03972.1 hypothetical protein [Candidatus Magasanikbacteria bacterium]
MKHEFGIKSFFVEVSLTMFLLLTNVFMGFFTHENLAQQDSLIYRIENTLTIQNILIAFVAGVIAYIVIQSIRK